jgi:hypothetical protein
MAIDIATKNASQLYPFAEPARKQGFACGGCRGYGAAPAIRSSGFIVLREGWKPAGRDAFQAGSGEPSPSLRLGRTRCAPTHYSRARRFLHQTETELRF